MKDKTLKQLVESIKASGKPKTSAYDTSATVTRVENGTAWVHIPGGVRETPVKLTIAAKAGDNVQVRVSGGRAFMVGNATAPPTDDRVATQALTETKTINKVVKAVQAVAEKAAKIAGNTNQYFWHTETGTDTGAHITEIPQEEFLADPTNGGGNLLARSNGVAIRDGLTEVAQFDNDGVTFNDSDGNANAEFGSNGFFIGQDTNTKISYNATNGLKLGRYVSILPTGLFDINAGDYRFFIDPTQYRKMELSSFSNILSIAYAGIKLWSDSAIKAECEGGSVDLQAYGTLLSGINAEFHLATEMRNSRQVAKVDVAGDEVNVNLYNPNFSEYGTMNVNGNFIANNVGAYYGNTKNVAITDTNINNMATGASVTVPAGTYMLFAYWNFDSVSSARVCNVDITAGSATYARERVVNAAGNWSRLNTSCVAIFSTSTTIYVKGSATVVSSAAGTGIQAIRIK